MEEKYMKTKKIIIITMCTLICIMAVGYAAFATQLTINGTASIESTWKILFTKIEEVSKTSGVTITNPPTASGTTATFNVDLTSPGDKIVYKITVANQGSLDAVIDKITESETGSDAIKFEVSGITKGDKLSKGTSTTFNVTISYDSSVTTQPSKTNNNLTVSINYIQYVNSTTPGGDEPTNPNTLVYKILNSNQAQPDTNIDFSQPSSDTNGKGLYYTSTNTEDNKVTYYFRGAVENNYVSFADLDWRIIRINEDGSIRLILSDTIGSSVFNESSDNNAYVGYMYGTPEASTYEETHANGERSELNQMLFDWFWNGSIYDYESYLADAGFCNDRSVAPSANTWASGDTALGYGSNFTVYGAMHRLLGGEGVKPQFKCPQSNDLYTSDESESGNKALMVSVGTITLDEVIYAGGTVADNDTYYLAGGQDFWTMTPVAFSDNCAEVYYVAEGRFIRSSKVTDHLSVRPVINLKSTVEVTSGGDGTENNPYVIKTS